MYLKRHVYLATKLNFHNIFKHTWFQVISVIKSQFSIINIIRITISISKKLLWQGIVKWILQSILEKAEKFKK